MGRRPPATGLFVGFAATLGAAERLERRLHLSLPRVPRPAGEGFEAGDAVSGKTTLPIRNPLRVDPPS